MRELATDILTANRHDCAHNRDKIVFLMRVSNLYVFVIKHIVHEPFNISVYLHHSWCCCRNLCGHAALWLEFFSLLLHGRAKRKKNRARQNVFLFVKGKLWVTFFCICRKCNHDSFTKCYVSAFLLAATLIILRMWVLPPHTSINFFSILAMLHAEMRRDSEMCHLYRCRAFQLCKINYYKYHYNVITAWYCLQKTLFQHGPQQTNMARLQKQHIVYFLDYSAFCMFNPKITNMCHLI